MKENLKDISPILEETGRIIYSNANITVNTLPAILAALLLGACKYCQHIARIGSYRLRMYQAFNN